LQRIQDKIGNTVFIDFAWFAWIDNATDILPYFTTHLLVKLTQLTKLFYVNPDIMQYDLLSFMRTNVKETFC